MSTPPPTDRELDLLKVLWRRGEATVREVYEDLRDELGIAQNTVQALLRTMAEKQLVTFVTRGRSFVYRAAVEPEATRTGLLARVLDRVYDGALGELVEGAVRARPPSADDLARLRALVDELEADGGAE